MRPPPGNPPAAGSLNSTGILWRDNGPNSLTCLPCLPAIVLRALQDRLVWTTLPAPTGSGLPLASLPPSTPQSALHHSGSTPAISRQSHSTPMADQPGVAHPAHPAPSIASGSSPVPAPLSSPAILPCRPLLHRDPPTPAPHLKKSIAASTPPTPQPLCLSQSAHIL